MFKSNKGFTLVELIVVIAILAILAGVAIPVYNGYIKRAQDAAVVTELDAIQTAAQAANATAGEINYIVVDSTSISIGGTNNLLASNFNDDFGLFYPDALGEGGDLGVFAVGIDLQGSYENGATWKNGEWTKGADSSIIVSQDKASVGGNLACDHEYVAGDPVAPTCTVDGYTPYTCSKCGRVEKKDIVAATGHTGTEDDHICDECHTDVSLSTGDDDLGYIPAS